MYYIIDRLEHGNGGLYGQKVLAEFNTLEEALANAPYTYGIYYKSWGYWPVITDDRKDINDYIYKWDGEDEEKWELNEDGNDTNEREFKVGDEVLVRYDNKMWLAKVEKITPSGRVKVGDTYYKKDGHEIGGGWYKKRITRPTNKDKDEIKRRKLINTLTSFDWDKVSLSVLSHILYEAKNDKYL
jgi:hypothetical protein